MVEMVKYSKVSIEDNFLRIYIKEQLLLTQQTAFGAVVLTALILMNL